MSRSETESDVELALVTAPDAETAERIARALVGERLAACVNLVPGLRSIYRWEGRVESEAEVLLVVKTRRDRAGDLEERVLGFSEPMAAAKAELKAFLHEHLYHHPRVVRMTRKAEHVLGDLYRSYREDPRQLPGSVRQRFASEGEARAIADYIAGMTDRFALAEHRKLLDPHEPV